MPLPGGNPIPEAGHQISDKYTLGNKIGQGGFGTVFECQNTETGETVAVKRMSLRNLSKDQLSAIELEISLLKKLDHPNIVKYIDTVRSDDHLHIVLEFIENGSLTRNIQKFGVLREPLVALYIRQVLHGLAYLHEQGVIHRDIKGPNILTTKAGQVKLADFGVATHASDNSNEVVGTPYWMAPEIIEMNGPTSACDIWSVGCTIVELLTTKPPYYDIPPMAALYRIVQDDHPPYPEGISPALEDFLSKCFKKEPLLRSSAVDLIRHRWIRKERTIDENDATGPRLSTGQETADVVVQRGSEEIQSQTSVAKYASNDELSQRTQAKGIETQQQEHQNGEDRRMEILRTSKANDDSERISWQNSIRNTIRLSGRDSIGSFASGIAPVVPPRRVGSRGTGSRDMQRKSTTEEASEGDGSLQLRGNSKLKEGSDDEDWGSFDQETNQNRNSAAANSLQVVQQQWRAVNGSDEIGDETSNANASDIFGGFDSSDLDQAFSDEENDQTGSGRNSPKNGSMGGGNSLNKLDRFRESDDEEFGDIEVPLKVQSQRLSMQLRQRHHKSSRKEHQNELVITEEDDESFSGDSFSEDDPFADDAFNDWEDEKDFKQDATRTLAAQQQAETRALIGLLNPQEPSHVVLNACDKLAAIFEEQPAQRRSLLTHHGVIPIMEMLEVSDPEVLHAVLKVLGQIIENDRMVQELLSLAGLIPIIAKFVAPHIVRPIRLQAASLVKQLLITSKTTLQMFIACGGLKVLVELLHPATIYSGNVSNSINASAASAAALANARRTGKTNPDTTSNEKKSELRISADQQTVVSGDGKQLSDFALSFIAIDGIQLVFMSGSESGGKIPKNDFCQLFAKADLLVHLARLLRDLQSNQARAQCLQLGIDAGVFISKISETFLVFSQGDANVKRSVADVSVLKSILGSATYHTQRIISGPQATNQLECDMTVLKNLLKCIKNLSMESSALHALQLAGCIPTLVPFLNFEIPSKVVNETHSGADDLTTVTVEGDGGTVGLASKGYTAGTVSQSNMIKQSVKEIHNMVMLSMFYMCRLNKARQEQAAVSGIIEPLKHAIVTKSPVKTFALQILCDLAHTSGLTRQQLWHFGGMQFFLDLLVSADVFWQEKALMSLEAWLSNATPEVEREILTPNALEKLVTLFQSAKSTNFENVVKVLLVMLVKSPKLSEALGRSGLFMAELVVRLGFPKAEVRINLLKMLKVIGEYHRDLPHLILDHNMFVIVTSIAAEAELAQRVLVVEIANQLLQEWSVALGL